MNVLYVFSGEQAQGAEIVIERLMLYNAAVTNTHLFISPGDFAYKLIEDGKPYKTTMLSGLRRLYRRKTNGFSFYFKAMANHFSISCKAYRYIRKENIAAIHANNIVAASYLLPALVAAKIFLRKRIWIWSDHDMHYASKADKAIAKIAARLYDRTLTVSEAVSKKYPGNKKVQVLYNGLDTGLFKPDGRTRKDFRSRLNLPDAAVVLGMAGKIIPGKGQLGLVKVFKELVKAVPHSYLILAGGFAADHPGYSEAIRNAIAGHPHIIYLGFLNDILPYYNGCDIIISNSDHTMSESLGTTIYEAMALEKIVVASRTGGTPEIISDGSDGFLFEPGDTAGLQRILASVLQNAPLNRSIQIAARKKVEAKFNIAGMALQYNHILKAPGNEARANNGVPIQDGPAKPFYKRKTW